MKKIAIILIGLLLPLGAMAQSRDKGAVEKNPPVVASGTVNLIDLSSSPAYLTFSPTTCTASSCTFVSSSNFSLLTSNNLLRPSTDVVPYHSAADGADRQILGGMLRGGRGGTTCFDEMYPLTGGKFDCQVSFTNEGTGSGGASQSGEAGHPGVMSCNAGTATTSGCGFQSGGNASTAVSTLVQVLVGSGIARSGAVLKVLNLSDATDTFTTFMAGFSSMVWTTVGAKTEAASGIYFRCVDCRTGAGTILGVVRASGADQGTCSTGIILDTGWHTYETITNALATATDFYIDGVNKCTVTATHPVVGMALQPGGILRTAGTTNARHLALDAFWYSIDFTTAR